MIQNIVILVSPSLPYLQCITP